MSQNQSINEAVTVSGLSISRAGRKLFDGMSWKLPSGSFLAITGPSGAGKSSLLACLAGELDANEGSFSIRDGNIGCIFQDFRLSENLSVLNNVLCGCLGRHSWWKTFFRFDIEEREEAFEIANFLGLSTLVHKASHKTSGGEQQRTAVARALMQRPETILADEPTSQLDSDTARVVLGKLRDIARSGKTVIAVLHDSRLVDEFADFELVIDSGLETGWEFKKREATQR